MENHQSSFTVRPNWTVGISILLILLFEYMMVAPLIRARIEASKLTKYGTRTEAEVFYPGYTTSLSYFPVDLQSLFYRFSANDPKSGQITIFTDSQFVGRNTSQRLNSGDHITIIYLSSDPTISRLTGTDTDDSDLSDYPLFSALCGIPIFIGLGVGWTWLKRKSNGKHVEDSADPYGSINPRQRMVPCPYCGRGITDDAIDCLPCGREVYDVLHNR